MINFLKTPIVRHRPITEERYESSSESEENVVGYDESSHRHDTSRTSTPARHGQGASFDNPSSDVAPVCPTERGKEVKTAIENKTPRKGFFECQKLGSPQSSTSHNLAQYVGHEHSSAATRHEFQPSTSHDIEPMSTGHSSGTVKLRRMRQGIRALKRRRKYRTSTELFLRKLPFARLLREVVIEVSPSVHNWTSSAILALQDFAEFYLVALFEDAARSMHAKQTTLRKADLQHVIKLRDLLVFF